jgi:hypothetical protein
MKKGTRKAMKVGGEGKFQKKLLSGESSFQERELSFLPFSFLITKFILVRA